MLATLPPGNRHMWRFRPILSGLATFVLLQGATAADHDKDLSDLMAQLAQSQHSRASFIEKQFIKILDRPIESSGELFYDAPDYLEKRTLKPRLESIILERDIISIKRGKFARSFSIETYPQLGVLMMSIRQMLSGDLTGLSRSFAHNFESGINGWTLVLIPHDPKVTLIVSKIILSGGGGEIRNIEFKRGNGDYSVMSLGMKSNN